MALATRSRTQNPQGKWGRRENLTHIHRKNAKESENPEEGYALMGFQPRGIQQNRMRNPDERRSDVRVKQVPLQLHKSWRDGKP